MDRLEGRQLGFGAFLSAWLGGVLLAATGGYEAVWLIDVALCAFASIMSLLIREGDAGFRSFDHMRSTADAKAAASPDMLFNVFDERLGFLG